MATHETTSDAATEGEPGPERPSEREPGPVVKSSPQEGGTKHAHPSEMEYVKVALVLAAITLAEVLVYYVESLEGLLVPILAVMSIAKFGIVALWFMHLRFDSRLFRRLFVMGISLAVFVYTVTLLTFHVFTR